MDPRNLHTGEQAGTQIRRIEWLILYLVVLAAYVIRIYHLGSFPDTVLGDEADNAQAAVRILAGQPPENGFFGLDWTQQPAFSVYKEAAFIAMFGFNIMAIRMPSALISALALIPFYLLLRRQFSLLPSLLASVLLATEVWYLNFSRSGWNCIDICFYMLMTMLFLMLALDALKLERGRPWHKWAYFSGAGFFAALGLYGYPAGRAITLALIGFFPIALAVYWTHRKTLMLGYLLLFGVETLVFAPQGIYAAQNWDRFNGRSGVVFILNQPEFRADPVGTMIKQVTNNLRGPWDGRVNNTAQYSPVGEPQLSRATGILVLIGMVLTFVISRLRRGPETWLWWVMLLAGWGMTQLITAHTPNGARGIGYMPTLIYFAGVCLDAILRGLSQVNARMAAGGARLRVAHWVAAALLTVAILLVGLANVAHYVEWQSTPRTRQDRYVYVTAQEFPLWAATISDLARNGDGSINVGQWREVYPIQDISNPYGTAP